jgi:hypothetical protein
VVRAGEKIRTGAALRDLCEQSRRRILYVAGEGEELGVHRRPNLGLVHVLEHPVDASDARLMHPRELFEVAAIQRDVVATAAEVVDQRGELVGREIRQR